MRSSETSALLSLLLLIGAAPEFAAAEVGSGPAVGSEYSLVPFHAATGDRAVYIAWRDSRSDVASGVLHLDDGTFAAFPTLASGYVTNLGAGAGGPAGARRAYATWVDGQMRLLLAVFDADGQVVSPPQGVTNSVQITPNQLVGTDAGLLVGHVWDSEPYWDPRILEVDAWGNVLGLEVAAAVGYPDQTTGMTLAGEPGGSHVIAFMTSDFRLRRYGPAGPLDASPVVVSGDATGDSPRSTILSQETPARALLSFPIPPATGTVPDVRFAVAPLSAEPVTVGPVLSDFVGRFVGQVSDLAALADPEPRAVAVWQELEFDDSCLCTEPPLVRVEFFALVLSVGQSITAEGEPSLIYRWNTGDPIGPPVTEPRVVVASDTPGRFTVVWSDGVLRYVDVDRGAVAVGEPAARPPAGSLSIHPNPFTRTTTIAYSLPRSGQARLTIVDVRGRVVARLLDGGQSHARGLVRWDGRDSEGSPLPAGIYVARLVAPGVIKSTKLVLSQ